MAGVLTEETVIIQEEIKSASTLRPPLISVELTKKSMKKGLSEPLRVAGIGFEPMTFGL